jgi:hypothetical protein
MKELDREDASRNHLICSISSVVDGGESIFTFIEQKSPTFLPLPQDGRNGFTIAFKRKICGWTS